MTTKFQKKRNGFSVTIPKKMVQKAKFNLNTEIDMKCEEGKIIIFLKKEKELTLKDIVKTITKDNRHPEIICDSVGKEIW